MTGQSTIEPKAQRLGPELFIGLVGAVGTDLGQVTEFLTKSLAAVGYSTARVSKSTTDAVPPLTAIRLARLLHKIAKYKNLPATPVDEYINQHMTAGDDFRKTVGRDDALAVMAIIDIMEERKDAADIAKTFEEIIPRRAYVLQSLKNPKEVTTLREVYGDGFFLVAAYSQHDARRDHLARRIGESRNDFPSEKHLSKAEALIQRDQEEPDISHGQNVRGLFHRADVFVDTTDLDSLRESLARFVELLFGNTFHTPTRDEYGMFHAQAAALRSAEPGRQVGAAVATGQGDIVAVGVNEVPKAGGGLYWCGDDPDGREFRSVQESGNDYQESNHKQIRNLVTDTLKLLKSAGWLEASKMELPTNALVELVLTGEKPPEGISREILEKVLDYLKRAQWLNAGKSTLELTQLVELAYDRTQPAIPKSAQIRNLIEFGRAVHAEMAALIDAARRGVSVAGCTMYVTTFPCHLCARHIVAAGIKRLVYIEPYAKSRTADLYPDSIAIEQSSAQKVQFEPFVGVAPKQYMKLFSTVQRMSDGRILMFDPLRANPRYNGNPRVYLENELEQTAILRNIMTQKSLYGG
ncbi:MAG TPA: anti-phage dCTP deaminase [Candidatus Dormibacteraeota bacterium]|nr:anti-phage dCTP deaminase [Candidatus Dormibacteraeota bacterium]